jgi:modulator of FtsH protease HflK
MNRNYTMTNRDDDLETRAKRGIKKWGPIAGIGLAAIVAFGLSYRTVAPQNLGVVTSLGQYSRTLEAGPHFIVPFIEGMTQVDVTTNKSIEIGFRTVKEATTTQKAVFKDASNDPDMVDEAQMLTADENIAWVSMVLQYKVNPQDVTDYLFNVKDQEGTIRLVGEAALRQVVGNYGVDEVITSGRAEITDKIRQESQKLFDLYGMGITVQGIYLQSTAAPNLAGTDPAKGTVSDAFQSVETARQAKDTTINDANTYKNQTVTQAEGEAQKIIADAEGQKATRVGAAQKDVAEFNLLLQQYMLDPAGTRSRLYLETMERIYPNLDKTIIDSSLTGGKTLPLLDLNGGNTGSNGGK